MSKGLYKSQPIFQQAIDDCAAILQPNMDCPLKELLFDADEKVLQQTRYTQPALFAVEYALAQLLLSTGVKPGFVMGHSVGEIVAACIASVMTLEDALYLVVKRGQLMDKLCQPGAMLSIAMDGPIVRKLLAQEQVELDIAAINAPLSTVVSGQQAAIDKFKQYLDAQDIQYRELNVSHGFHSKLMEPMLESFYDEIKTLSFSKPVIPMISNVIGQRVDDEVCNANYWVRHVRQPVDFFQGLEALCRDNVGCIIEVGARPVLSSQIKKIVPNSTSVLSIIDSYSDNSTSYYQLLLTLYEAGCTLDFTNTLINDQKTCLSHPPYPFCGDSYWVDTTPGRKSKALKDINLSDSGLSSLTATELYDFLKEKLSADISIGPLLGDETIESLLEQFCEKLLLTHSLVKNDSSNIKEQVHQIDESNTPITKVNPDTDLSVDSITSLHDAVALADTELLQNKVHAYLLEKVGKVTKTPVYKLDNKQQPFLLRTFTEIGFDSVISMELRERVQRDLCIDIPIKMLFEGITVEQIIEHICQQVQLAKIASKYEDTENEVPNAINQDYKKEVLVL
jgi:malonyl CoA-acyl carrier protein transacylase/acyl carrier protein